MSTLITKQAAFDRFIRDRVLGNVPRSITKDGNCVYDPSVNGGCAIGCLLPPGVYQPWFELCSVWELFLLPEIANLFENPRSHFWSLLQSLHDLSSREQFETNLIAIAQYLPDRDKEAA